MKHLIIFCLLFLSCNTFADDDLQAPEEQEQNEVSGGLNSTPEALSNTDIIVDFEAGLAEFTTTSNVNNVWSDAYKFVDKESRQSLRKFKKAIKNAYKIYGQHPTEIEQIMNELRGGANGKEYTKIAPIDITPDLVIEAAKIFKDRAKKENSHHNTLSE